MEIFFMAALFLLAYLHRQGIIIVLGRGGACDGIIDKSKL